MSSITNILTFFTQNGNRIGFNPIIRVVVIFFKAKDAVNSTTKYIPAVMFDIRNLFNQDIT